MQLEKNFSRESVKSLIFRLQMWMIDVNDRGLFELDNNGLTTKLTRKHYEVDT